MLIYYKEKSNNEICIMRVFSESGIIKIPATIDEKTVTEIGQYCFAPNGRHKDADVKLAEYDRDKKVAEEVEFSEQLHDLYKEACGNFVEEIILPGSIETISSCAFYNCKKLRRLSIPAGLRELGSDVFMNCINLSYISYMGTPEDKTPLKQLLAQISWDVEVNFSDKAMILYPEYFQGYDEIGPAHIFELNLTGEGFRTRQCFNDGKFSFDEYDNIFPKATAEESHKTLSFMALNRLVYPVGLSEKSRNMYMEYIGENESKIAKLIMTDPRFSKERREVYLEALIEGKCFKKETVEEIIRISAERQYAELSVLLIKWKSEYYGADIRKKYEFEDF